MTPALFHALLRELIDENPFAIRAALRILQVEFTEEIATLAVTCEARPRLLVNLGIVGFAIAVGWFYCGDIFDKMGRSLGLIGLGVLFLAGGWALEKTRHGLLARMGKKDNSALEAQ